MLVGVRSGLCLYRLWLVCVVSVGVGLLGCRLVFLVLLFLGSLWLKVIVLKGSFVRLWVGTLVLCVRLACLVLCFRGR